MYAVGNVSSGTVIQLSRAQEGNVQGYEHKEQFAKQNMCGFIGNFPSLPCSFLSRWTTIRVYVCLIVFSQRGCAATKYLPLSFYVQRSLLVLVKSSNLAFLFL